VGRPRTRAWPGDLFRRLTFERGARTDFPALRGHRTRSDGFHYDVDIELPLTGTVRHVTIVFGRHSAVPAVFADGPTSSPHRYDDSSLCMWYPGDPVSARWVFADGLLDLLDVIQNHLLREELWRRVGEWIGPEIPHTTGAAS
jgi:hypothetical protein